MDELRRHVERIVRPVYATGWRKNKMREELLSHLTQKIEDKLSSGVVEEDACRLAIEELGDSAVLTRELQATVPTLERIMLFRLPWTDIGDNWFEKGNDETAFHFALLRTLYTSIPLTLGIVAFEIARQAGILPGILAKSACGPLERTLLISVLFTAQMAAGGIAYFLADLIGIRNTLAHTSGGSLWRKAGALYAFIFGYSFLLIAFSIPAALAVHPLIPGPDHVLASLSSLVTGKESRVLLLCVLLFILWAPILGLIMKKEHEQYKKWGALNVDE